MTERIRVIVRIRPLNYAEILSNEETVIFEGRQKRDIFIRPRNGQDHVKLFSLSDVLNESASQETVFLEVEPILLSALEGSNGTILMYGQTGTGKTYSMLGYDLWSMVHDKKRDNKFFPAVLTESNNEWGIIPRALKWLFDTRKNIISQNKNFYEIKFAVSYVEIYNDIISDLLECYVDNSPKNLEIREDKYGNIHIPGLEQININNYEQALEVLWEGLLTRKSACTDLNDYSSRSHTIFIIYIQTYHKITDQKNQSKICLVDLAGSEKWKSSQLNTFSEQRIREINSINRSLSALGNCISSLIKQQQQQQHQPSASVSTHHIPYRDSKLTRLLQDSIGNTSKTLFIVTVSPSESCIEETYSSLQFAERAMKVQLNSSLNRVPPNQDHQRFQTAYSDKKEIKRLRHLLQLALLPSHHRSATANQRKDNDNDHDNDFDTAERCSSISLNSASVYSSISSRINNNNNNNDIDINQNQRHLSSLSAQLPPSLYPHGNTDIAALTDLKSQNDALLRELAIAHIELQKSKDEMKRVFEVIFDTANEMALPLPNSAKEEDASLSALIDDEKYAETLAAPALQFKLLQQQREAVEALSRSQDEVAAAQEARWRFLAEYQRWLESILPNHYHLQTFGNPPPQPETPFSFGQKVDLAEVRKPDGELKSTDKDSVLQDVRKSMDATAVEGELRQRLRQMEQAMQLQAEEIQWTKDMFSQISIELEHSLRRKSKDPYNDSFLSGLTQKSPSRNSNGYFQSLPAYCHQSNTPSHPPRSYTPSTASGVSEQQQPPTSRDSSRARRRPSSASSSTASQRAARKSTAFGSTFLQPVASSNGYRSDSAHGGGGRRRKQRPFAETERSWSEGRRRVQRVSRVEDDEDETSTRQRNDFKDFPLSPRRSSQHNTIAQQRYDYHSSIQSLREQSEMTSTSEPSNREKAVDRNNVFQLAEPPRCYYSNTSKNDSSNRNSSNNSRLHELNGFDQAAVTRNLNNSSGQSQIKEISSSKSESADTSRVPVQLSSSTVDWNLVRAETEALRKLHLKKYGSSSTAGAVAMSKDKSNDQEVSLSTAPQYINTSSSSNGNGKAVSMVKPDSSKHSNSNSSSSAVNGYDEESNLDDVCYEINTSNTGERKSDNQRMRIRMAGRERQEASRSIEENTSSVLQSEGNISVADLPASLTTTQDTSVQSVYVSAAAVEAEAVTTNVTHSDNSDLSGGHKNKSSKLKHVWKEYVDAATGFKYYFNRVTKSTTWNKPSEQELALRALLP